MAVLDWIRSRLIGRRLPLWAAVVAATLALPSLWVDWQLDDYFHSTMLKGLPEIGLPRKPITQLFAFVDGDPENLRAMMDSGVLPWWTYENIRLKFWRPLSSLSHWLDYRLWPSSPVLMHVHSLIWFAALVFLAGKLFRRLLGATWLAGLAALLYAVEDNHALPAAWIASRNALLSGFFSLLALYLHDRRRRDGWKPGGALAPLAFVAALFCGEAALGILGYLLAHALYLDPGRGGKRWAALLPYAAVAICWFAAYRLQGYGVSGSEPYNDPAADPLGFVVLVLQRFPLYLTGQFGLPPADVCSLVSLDVLRVLSIWAPLLLIFLACVFAPLLRRERMARFFALGMALAVLPLCSVFPMDRVLMLASFGGVGLIGMFLAGVVDKAAWLPDTKGRRRVAQTVAIVLFFIHGVLAPLGLLAESYLPAAFGNELKNTIRSVPIEADLEGRELIVVNMPDAFISSYIPIFRALDGHSVPRHTYALAPAGQSVELERLDERTLRLRSRIGLLPQPGTPVRDSWRSLVSFDYIHQRLNSLFRGPAHPLRPGDRIRLTGLEIEIAAADDARGPTEVVFRFSTPLEDPSLYWIRCAIEPGASPRYVPFVPPPLGATIRVE